MVMNTNNQHELQFYQLIKNTREAIACGMCTMCTISRFSSIKTATKEEEHKKNREELINVTDFNWFFIISTKEKKNSTNYGNKNEAKNKSTKYQQWSN